MQSWRLLSPKNVSACSYLVQKKGLFSTKESTEELESQRVLGMVPEMIKRLERLSLEKNKIVWETSLGTVGKVPYYLQETRSEKHKFCSLCPEISLEHVCLGR